MMHRIKLQTRDAQVISFDCDENESLLEGAARNEMILPSLCRQGSCGVCHAYCIEGDYRLGEHNPGALSSQDTSGSYVLLCRTYAQSDLVIEAPFDSTRIQNMESPVLTSRIRSIHRLPGQVIHLTIELIDEEGNPAAAQFEAGQYVELSVTVGEKNIQRAYSVANISNWDGILEFLIRLHPQGAFSHYLELQARPGDEVKVIGPSGGFTLQENGVRPRWFIGGGTGLAPLLSMLRRMAEWQDPQPVRLYLGVNTPEDWFAESLLEDFKQTLPRLEIVRCVWKCDGEWKGFIGTPADRLLEDLRNTGVSPDLYICGPSALIDAVEAVAASCSIPSSQIYAERFIALG